jgi:hypothetical protein
MKNGKYIGSAGGIFYYKNDLFHREDGPAVTYTGIFKGYQEWYIDGERINVQDNEEFLRLVKLKMFW